MARPTKYDADTARKVTDSIRVGATYKLACAFAGVSEDTFALWRKKHTEFADAVMQAEGGAAVGWLAKIEKAANEGIWQAAAWKLERRYPESYGRQVVTTINLTPEQARDLPDDEIEARLKKANLL